MSITGVGIRIDCIFSLVCLFIAGNGYHHPQCTEIDALQAKMEIPGPGSCGGGGAGGGGFGSGSRSAGSRSRRGSSRTTDAIDVVDTKEKTVNFANCVSPPSPHDPGFMGINNEAYPCDCCHLDETQFQRSYSHQMPCPPACAPAGIMHFSEVRDFTNIETSQRRLRIAGDGCGDI
jgi:hypothetical protein